MRRETARLAKTLVQFAENVPNILERHGLSGSAIAAVERSLDALRSELAVRINADFARTARSDGDAHEAAG